MKHDYGSPLERDVMVLDDTKTRIIFAAMKAVRQYGLEGVRIQNVSELAGISPGALYRYFESKDQLLVACFTYVDKQAAAIFDHLKLNPLTMLTNPMGAVKGLWLPYFRYWTSHPDETIFYHRFRDSAFFPKYDKVRDFTYFNTFIRMVHLFKKVFPALDRINQDLLWLHVLTSTVMYAKYVVEGTLPNNQETEETIFQLLTTGLSGYLKPEKPSPEDPHLKHAAIYGVFCCGVSKCLLPDVRCLVHGYVLNRPCSQTCLYQMSGRRLHNGVHSPSAQAAPTRRVSEWKKF